MKHPRDHISGARPPRRSRAPHRFRPDQRIDLLTDSAARTMQQNALVLRADLQHRAGFLGVAAFHVTQQDHRPLAGGQPIDYHLYVIPQLASADNALRVQFVPQFGSLHPVTVRPEFGQRHAALGRGRALHQRAHSDEAAFAGHPGARPVHDDAENPGHQARTLLEAADPRVHREPRILYNLLRLGVAADDGRSEAYERGVEPADQQTIGGGVALPQTRQESGIVELGRTNRLV